MNGEQLPLLRPMLAVSSEPFDSAAYLYEIKWDGYRGLAYLDAGTVIRSRNLINLTGKFPELAGLHKKVRRLPAIIDGEIVVLVQGKPSFASLQSRGKMAGAGQNSRAGFYPVVFIAFDVLYANGKSVLRQPLADRKNILKEMVLPGDDILLSRYVFRDGIDFYNACVKEGLEGAVAKKVESVYLPGRRSASWKKFRNTREADLVICGYQPGVNGRGLGSLVLGGIRHGELVYQGKVGTGFNSREAEILLDGLHKIETADAPLEDLPVNERGRTRWVRPLLVCTVVYLTATAGGYLRHPVFQGVRWDKSPDECPAVTGE
ncbi:MAG: putative DNA ligase-like protein [Pelotomaculum sp. PtaB.Bin013]|uniref:DNA ligase (ATP) n=1 Tax=Pelotomaculum isophthalicicum JI TaxID=947010 RepID=A0A9X4JVE7_9FIRM|nr:non-homologous end-joining DNA ligase [Pelotomaculum isophthalicicum]MDF9407257.1 non-homologous end-joining DNA ligase [Pelotomaculum isophthalicicum JI]OPX92080.1 MAG: putative DNA ligase-like protein [Pelotomaculum sp. PtaB.Bin013]